MSVYLPAIASPFANLSCLNAVTPVMLSAKVALPSAKTKGGLNRSSPTTGLGQKARQYRGILPTPPFLEQAFGSLGVYHFHFPPVAPHMPGDKVLPAVDGDDVRGRRQLQKHPHIL
jgi:hypothetical protein